VWERDKAGATDCQKIADEGCMNGRARETQENLAFQLSLLNLFAANRASDDSSKREACRLEDMLAQLDESA